MMMVSDEKHEAVLSTARAIGAEHGENAAAWWEQDAIGGRATGDGTETARWVLAGLADGDPVVYDALPGPDLSGQWADSFTSNDLIREATAGLADVVSEKELEDYVVDGFNEICDAYDDSFYMACQGAVETYCRRLLEV